MTGRKTHDYPDGKPTPMVLTEVAFGVVGLFWIFGSITWLRVAVFGTLFIAFVFVRSELLQRYEQVGRAVPIPKTPRKRTTYPDGIPTPMRVMRFTVLIPMIAMIAFGMAPLAMARSGIIACVLILFVMAGAYVGLERHYVHIGRAQEVDDNKVAKV